ncbi:hypothetical protein CcaverHIS002_0602790 [Cutaneotrichosporon cavernicola]|nr:hypothetical protein CcaverHIS002_0602790 [Cutaneotrichosporon cavernicola]BEJ01546.1 hypothetical protein CcaverHIS631_0602280 [Cutaneotrichosporon cavernicola]BEJ09310.1 hypothetical protein CcaverHIS641_0602250 [Cutaneotrichosporon cavernicola]
MSFPPDLDDSQQLPSGKKEIDFHTEHPLFQDLCPDDSYTPEGVYWADLPWKERQTWVNEQSNAETKRELKVVWDMFKKDPLSPLNAYCSRYVITGFGMFTEGYTIFSIGNLMSLYTAVWPECWGTHEVCDKNWIAAVSYIQIIGIICGQIGVGIEGDWIGRRVGLVQDALVMVLGLVMLTASWGTTLNGWVICYAWSQFVYTLGVGGEYPMTSTSALEHAAPSGTAQRDDKLHRGRNVVLAFLMQGWGQLVNQGVLIILLLIFHGGSTPPYSKKTGQWVFRVSFAFMIPFTLWLAYWRYYKKQYSEHALRKSKKDAHVNQSGYDMASLKLVVSHFGGRLVGTCLGWLFADFLFYGAKLFQSTFIKVITPNSTGVMTGWLWNLLNVGVSMFGYYLAAFLVDHKFYGRKRMQTIGFLLLGILYLLPAIWFHQLQSMEHIKGFQTIYFLASFFTQFGPNCTTFLLAAEVFPVSVRATAHGLSAASGKVGALLPAIIYNYIDNRTKFWAVCWFGFAGWITTQMFIPDVTGLDLREQDRYWAFVREGRAKDYHGIAVHPRHLSMWERVVLKRHRAYDPELDRQSRVKELRVMWEARNQIKEEGGRIDIEDHEDDELSSTAHSFFERELRTLEKPRDCSLSHTPSRTPSRLSRRLSLTGLSHTPQQHDTRDVHDAPNEKQ